MKRLSLIKTMFVLTLAFAVFMVAASAFAETWSFGVMSDTQWPNSPDYKNPNVAVNIINHINQEFINKGVKFVVQVGDLTDKPSTIAANPALTTNLDIRATFAQDLYNAGIGFYPLRGNHEDKPTAPSGTTPATEFYGAYAREFQRIFPQTQTGVNNQTPIDAMVTTTTYGPQANTYGTFTVGSNFASEPGFEGLTYSFDYNNVRIVMIDQFTVPSGTSHSVLNSTDVDWVGSRLSTKPANTHAFVFGHKGLITENHNDNLFGSTPDTSSGATWPLTNTFVSYLQNNGVRYYMGGHDHMHNRAIVTSPNGLSKVQNIIGASDSYKFYIPPTMATFNTQTWRPRETPIAQELFAVGYYIYTVDGPKVTVDYYAMPNGCNGDCDLTYDVIPYDTVPFTKHETYGYSLNGKEILVPQGGSYALTDDTNRAVANGEPGYIGTTAAILSGINGSTGTDYNNRALTKTVDTGWAPATVKTPKTDGDTASDILTLWGMTDSLATDFSDLTNANYHYKYVVPCEQTDTHALSISYDPTKSRPEHLGKGLFGLATRDTNGNWINAADANFGGTTKFVKGAWKPGYDLGTYGIDPDTKTAWAVINYNGDFAVACFNNK